VLVFHLTNAKVQQIVTSKPKKKTLTLEQERQERRRERDRERRERNRRAAQEKEKVEDSHYPSVQIQQQYTAPFYGFADKEMDENKGKPYGGILSEADADTSKTYPTAADRKRFEEARQKAEEDWKRKQDALYAQEPPKPAKHVGPPSKIKCINFAGWEIDTWHAAPYPEEYSKNRVLHICEFCLKYMNSDYVAWRHKVRQTMLFNDTANNNSSNAPQSTLLAMKSTVTDNTLSSRSTVERTPSTVRTYASLPSFSWDPRPCTTTWSRSSSTS
jgi:histone acetyltransferase SAS3